MAKAQTGGGPGLAPNFGTGGTQTGTSRPSGSNRPSAPSILADPRRPPANLVNLEKNPYVEKTADSEDETNVKAPNGAGGPSVPKDVQAGLNEPGGGFTALMMGVRPGMQGYGAGATPGPGLTIANDPSTSNTNATTFTGSGGPRVTGKPVIGETKPKGAF
jgi:hypothetical protein